MSPQLLELTQTQAAVAALVGALLPVLLSIPIQYNWPTQFKAVFSLAMYGAAAVAVAAAAGTLTGATWWQTALLIFLTGATSHQTFWKPTDITTALEIATTPTQKVTEAIAKQTSPVEAARSVVNAAAIAAARASAENERRVPPAGRPSGQLVSSRGRLYYDR